MIQGHEKWRVLDQNGDNEFFMEVNWSKDKKVQDCKLVKFTFPDGTETIVKREHLNAILFAIGRKEDQRKMIPQRDISVRYHKTVLGVTATKDIAKGEMINFPIEFPCENYSKYEDIIGGAGR